MKEVIRGQCDKGAEPAVAPDKAKKDGDCLRHGEERGRRETFSAREREGPKL